MNSWSPGVRLNKLTTKGVTVFFPQQCVKSEGHKDDLMTSGKIQQLPTFYQSTKGAKKMLDKKRTKNDDLHTEQQAQITVSSTSQ